MVRSTLVFLAGCALAQVLGLAGGVRAPLTLTAEQLEILSHMHLVNTQDGFGHALATIQIEGANVQIVNGKGHTRDTNGLGNLIVGYQEIAGPVDRTGSHNVIIGAANEYSSYSGLCNGGGNQLLGPGCTVLSGNESIARGTLTAVIGGSRNDIDGIGSVAVAGEFNSIVSDAGTGNLILGGGGARIAGGAHAHMILGGFGNSIEGGEYGVVAGGDSNSVTESSFACVFGSSRARVFGGESGTMLGGKDNVMGTAADYLIAPTLVGGQGNSIVNEDYGTVVGGQHNTAAGKWATVTGGAHRSANGTNDWVAGGLFQDD